MTSAEGFEIHFQLADMRSAAGFEKIVTSAVAIHSAEVVLLGHCVQLGHYVQVVDWKKDWSSERDPCGYCRLIAY